MKMNYQSGDKKNILGQRLSNRYLSSDAFTSSAGKMSGRSISRLGSIFKGNKSGRRFSGTGQKVGLFELKNVVIKLCFVIACVVMISYTLPLTRYYVHSLFAKHSGAFNSNYENIKESEDVLSENEKYVSPVFLDTDRFLINIDEQANFQNGSYIYVSPANTLVGVLEIATSSASHVVLFSEVGFKNNFFLKDSVTKTPVSESDIEAVVGTSSESGTTSVSNVVVKPEPNFSSIVFEGLGYGQMLAKVPPQIEISVGTILYTRTRGGLIAVGQVSYVEKDNGSTFTNIYAQILTAPYSIYKVKVENILN